MKFTNSQVSGDREEFGAVEIPWVLGQLGDIAGTILDVLAAPAILSISLKGPTAGLQDRILLAGIATVIAWIAIALAARWMLSSLSSWLRFGILPVMCRTGDLKSVRSTVRAAYRMCSFLDRAASFFTITTAGSEQEPDDFASFTRYQRRNLALATLRFLTWAPYGVTQTVKQLLRFMVSRVGIMLFITVAWASIRPPASFWAPGTDFALRIGDVLSQGAVVAWVPVVLLLLAVVSTAQVRGAYAWRTEKFKQAYSALDALSHKAEPLWFDLHQAIDDSARFFSHTVVPEATKVLTSGHGTWEEGGIISFTGQLESHALRWGHHNFEEPGPPWNWKEGGACSRGDHLLDSARELVDEYRQKCAESNLSDEVHKIAPRNVRSLFMYLRPYGRDIARGAVRQDNVPYLGGGARLGLLTKEGLEARIIVWLDRESYWIRSKFENLEDGSSPDKQAKSAAIREVATLVNELRMCLIQACWLEEQLGELVNAGWKNRYPRRLSAIWQSVKSR